MIGKRVHYILIDAGRSGHLEVIGEDDELDSYLCFERVVDLLGPDES